MTQRMTPVGLVAVLVLILAMVHAQEPNRLANVPEALRGLRSRDMATFAVSCETFKNIHSDSLDGLLHIAQGPAEAGDELRVRKAIETLAALNYDKAIPLCIKRVDYVHAMPIASESDPILKDLPFARSLADFGRPGVDAVLEYLTHGNTEGESEERLLLFAFVLQGGYLLDRQYETLEDYTIRYSRGRSSPRLERLLQYLRLDPSELAMIIEKRPRDGK
jgi:hypothetical protein